MKAPLGGCFLNQTLYMNETLLYGVDKKDPICYRLDNEPLGETKPLKGFAA